MQDHSGSPDVCFWHLADLRVLAVNVRFWPDHERLGIFGSGDQTALRRSPLRTRVATRTGRRGRRGHLVGKAIFLLR